MKLVTKFRIYCALERARTPRYLKRFLRLHGNDPTFQAILRLRQALLDDYRQWSSTSQGANGGLTT